MPRRCSKIASRNSPSLLITDDAQPQPEGLGNVRHISYGKFGTTYSCYSQVFGRDSFGKDTIVAGEHAWAYFDAAGTDRWWVVDGRTGYVAAGSVPGAALRWGSGFRSL